MKRVSLPGEGLVDLERCMGLTSSSHKGKDQQGMHGGEVCWSGWWRAFIPPEEREGVEGDHPSQYKHTCSFPWTLASVLLCLATPWIHDFRVIRKLIFQGRSGRLADS